MATPVLWQRRNYQRHRLSSSESVSVLESVSVSEPASDSSTANWGLWTSPCWRISAALLVLCMTWRSPGSPQVCNADLGPVRFQGTWISLRLPWSPWMLSSVTCIPKNLYTLGPFLSGSVPDAITALAASILSLSRNDLSTLPCADGACASCQHPHSLLKDDLMIERWHCFWDCFVQIRQTSLPSIVSPT